MTSDNEVQLREYGSQGSGLARGSESAWARKGERALHSGTEKALQRATGRTTCPYLGDSDTFSKGENKWQITEVLDGK